MEDPRPTGPREGLQLRGQWTAEVIGPDGQVKEKREADNLVVNDGLDWFVDYAFLGCDPTSQPDPMCYIAIGSDSTTVTAADSALGTELARELEDTITQGGVGVITVDTTFAAGTGTGSVAEAGIFNASSSGTMFNRVTFGAVTKGAGDTLKMTCTITVSAS